MTRIAIGSQSTATGASSLTTNSPSATAGNLLVLEISWVNSSSDGTTKTPTAPAGWSTALAIASAVNGSNGRAGYSVFYKTAAGGVESPVMNDPSGGSVLYAHGIISEFPTGTTFDSSATSGANTTNNSAASTTGVTVPSTGTLASANSEVLTGVAIIAGTGISNAGIALSGGGWTTDMSDQDTTSSVGAVQGYKAVAATTALDAVYTWTGDPSMFCYQAGIVVFSGAPAGPTIDTQPQPVTVYEGEAANFSISATTSGGTLHYQWKQNGGNVGTDSSSLSISPTALSDNGTSITCDVSDDNGTRSSSAALLTVIATAVTAWLQA